MAVLARSRASTANGRSCTSGRQPGLIEDPITSERESCNPESTHPLLCCEDCFGEADHVSFETDVLRPIQRLLGPQVRVPAGVRWTHQRLDDGQRIVASVSVDQLCKNFQTDSCAAPAFLMAFAFWLELVTGQRVRCRLVVDGDPPPPGTPLRLHWHRSLFLIEEMERLLGDRFEAQMPERWAWPALPALNHAVGPRQTRSGDGDHRERRLETSICESAASRDAFSQHIEPIVSFRRQLPVGLFDGSVSRGSRWTPGGSSQVDLWAPSCDGKTLHLFELKIAGNVKLGSCRKHSTTPA